MRFLNYSCLKPNPGFLPSKIRCSWCPLFGDSVQPTERSHHAVCVYNNRIFMYGGRGHKGTLNQFWVYDCDNLQWNELCLGKDSPPRLEGHTMEVHDDKIYIFGGETSFASADESPLWEYDIITEKWEKIGSNGTVMAPQGRRQHTSVLYMNTMCIYGGYQDLIGPTKEMWLFDFGTKSWHFDVAASGETAPDARYGHCAVVNNQSMWVCGGLTGLRPNSEVLNWNFELMLWMTVKAKGGPSELSGHAICTAHNVLYVLGGCNNIGEASDDTWMLSLADNVWKKCLSTDMKPPAISGHTLTILHTPNFLKKNDLRTRSVPNMKKKRSSVKASSSKQRSVSCGKLPNEANYTNRAYIGSVSQEDGANEPNDDTPLAPSNRKDMKVKYAFENPFAEIIDNDIEIIPKFEPLPAWPAKKFGGVLSVWKSNPRPFSVSSTGKKSYISSRLQYGNISTGGSTVKTFSYNLIRDPLPVTTVNSCETSFIEIPAEKLVQAVQKEKSHGDPGTETTLFPKITNVKPLFPDVTDTAADSKPVSMELESLDHDIVDEDDSSELAHSDIFSASPISETLNNNFQATLAPSSENEFLILVLGGKVSNSPPFSGKPFSMWQCRITIDS